MLLQWDNSYSWMASKTITYSLELKEPFQRSILPQTDATPQVVFVLGGPGSGKGTQCSLLASKFGMCHLSAGDLLRAERNNKESKNGALISDYIFNGKIVPVEITIKLLYAAMEASGQRRFLIDGFPRSLNNYQGWQSVVGARASVVGCLFFDCTEEVMQARLLSRGKTSGRVDDNLEAIQKRFRTYVQETKPVLEVFKRDNKLWRVDTTQSIEDVSVAVETMLKEHPVLDLEDPLRGVILAQMKNPQGLKKILGTMTLGNGGEQG